MLRLNLLVVALLCGIAYCNAVYSGDPKDNLHQRLTEALDKLIGLQASNRQLEQTLTELRGKIAELETVRHNESIGFLAIPVNDNDYSADQQVIFDLDLFNPGNYYNTATSTFTCPVGGYYWFSVSVLSDSRVGLDDEMFGAVYINTIPQFRATAKARETNDQGSNSGIVYCFAGDIVRVFCETTSSGTFRNIGSNESSFSGFLLYEGGL